MAEAENVKVAVRVRPFNSREKARNATLIIDMKGPTTYIKDPENMSAEPRKFNFDFSYWSHDGFKEESNGYMIPDKSHPNGGKYSDQSYVYDNLGAGILSNAWDGYNSTLFAYGQTGSGKSYSMVGYGVNKGIVPQFCDKLFKGIEDKKAEGVDAQYEVTFSMLEIYNEQVRDLLNPKSNKKGGLKVRQHPKQGFYAEGLTQAAVDSYKSIDAKMDEGTTNRTVAATNMNATSSRAHTIVGIYFVQKAKNKAGEEMAKTSIVNLVDLAGSERAESTGATGDRLKEGAAINQSLSTLGNVISALADNSSGKQTRVPYRDSVLTKLLKNALGGNSKTIMIAAVSPADINYDESLSTLRYADRAKQIKTVAQVNEDPTEKLIRELQEENEKLKKMMAAGGKIDLGSEDTAGMTEAEKEALRQELEEDYKARMAESQQEIEEMKRSWQEKLAAAAASGGDDRAAMIERKKTEVHISNLNVDPMLSGNIVYFLDCSKSIGKESEIVIRGPNIQKEQAKFIVEGGKYYIDKSGDAKVMKNGLPVTNKTELHHTDRLVFGTTVMYVFYNPKEASSSGQQYPEITHEMAQEEIAANSGFDMNTENKSRDEMLLQEDLIEILPAISEANAISEELDKKKKFEVLLVSGAARGDPKGRTQVFVKMIDLETDHEFNWTREKFLNRKYVMQEMFENYTDGESWELPADRDPFAEDPNSEVLIGNVQVYMQSLAYMIEMKEQLDIVDYKGSSVGHVNLEIVPCNKKGKEYTENDDIWVDNPKDMIGKDLHFNLKILSARGIPSRFTGVRACCKLYLEDEVTTKAIDSTSNPDWNFKKQFSFPTATAQLIDYLSDNMMIVEIWGKQKPPKTKKTVNTKDIMNKQALAKGAVGGDTNTQKIDASKVRYAMELAVFKKRTEKSEQKVAQFRELVQLAEKYQKPRISTKLIKDLLAAPSNDAAQKCLKLVEKEKGADDEETNARVSSPTKIKNGEVVGGDDGKSKSCVIL